jgi:hypothetical protein
MITSLHGRTLTAIVLCLLAVPVTAGPQWLLELGSSTPVSGAAADADCDEPDSEPARFLSCGQPVDSEAGNGGAWALGFRLGRYDGSTVQARLPQADQADETLHARLSSVYALAQLRREWGTGVGRLRPYVAGGAGVARTSVRDFQRRGDDFLQQAPDGDASGYILRLEAGLIWQFGDRLQMGLALRQDALDAWATPRGDGWLEEGGDRQTREFAATRARLGYRSATINLSWPFGRARGDVGD